MSSELDTKASSAITSHSFEPRAQTLNILPAGPYDRTAEEVEEEIIRLPPNQYLCQHCRLAEAAHQETMGVGEGTNP